MTVQTNQTESKSSLRVDVNLLDTLMNLAGELVLSRNQLLQGITSANSKATELSSQRIDMITSELQDAIMRTRMQPIGNILSKLNRVVRDLSQQLGKTVSLTLEGSDVELDKTILEAITDPLTHLIQNAVVHGIEMPEEREKAGKNVEGNLKIRAFHDAGQVNIIISDDGKGYDADKIRSTAIENLGGVIELDSIPGRGTDIQIKLPLTLAIIPSQITCVGEERYAIPQVNLGELLRIPASEIKERIERVGDGELVRLRGELLPILNLSEMLGIPRTFINPETGEDRRKSNGHAIHIAVVSAGAFKYGLVVDRFHDSEEIVVKPVGRHLKQCSAYAGATIMGDGKVALILDISNIADMAGLSAVSESAQTVKAGKTAMDAERDKASLLTFKNGDMEYFAAPLSLVERIEQIRSDEIEIIGSSKVVQYRGGALPLYELSQIGPFNPLPERKNHEVIVFKVKDREVGLMVTPPVDALEVLMDVAATTLKHKAISGSMTIKAHTTLLVDIFEMMKTLKPEWFAEESKLVSELQAAGGKSQENRNIIVNSEEEYRRVEI